MVLHIFLSRTAIPQQIMHYLNIYAIISQLEPMVMWEKDTRLQSVTFLSQIWFEELEQLESFHMNINWHAYSLGCGPTYIVKCEIENGVLHRIFCSVKLVFTWKRSFLTGVTFLSQVYFYRIRSVIRQKHNIFLYFGISCDGPVS